MDSLTRFVHKNLEGGEHWTNKFAKNTKKGFDDLWHTLNNPDAQKWFFFIICIPAALFIILSPGIIINLPVISLQNCEILVPLPEGVTGSCAAGVYVEGTSDILDASQGLPICKQRAICNHLGASGYTSVDSVVIHSLLFVVLLVLIRIVLKAGGFAPSD
jgi:hypothetical protein